MGKKDYHATPHPEGGWQVRREGGERASSRHETQSDAIERGRELAIQEKVELVIHRQDGTIRDSDSYGNDPTRSRDRKH